TGEQVAPQFVRAQHVELHWAVHSEQVQVTAHHAEEPGVRSAPLEQLHGIGFAFTDFHAPDWRAPGFADPDAWLALGTAESHANHWRDVSSTQTLALRQVGSDERRKSHHYQE